MDRFWFQDQLRRVERTQADVARALGVDPSAISKLLKGERLLKLVEAPKLARLLDVPYDMLLARAGIDADPASASAATMALPGGEAARAPAPERGDLGDLIPIRSGARGGGDQEMFLGDGPIDYVPRPALLRNVRDAYAIYVVGESMSPRYRPGQLLHINPHRPPVAGRGVVVTKRDRTVLIKEFVRRTPAALLLREYNPVPREFDVQLADVADVHVVVATIEE